MFNYMEYSSPFPPCPLLYFFSPNWCWPSGSRTERNVIVCPNLSSSHCICDTKSAGINAFCPNWDYKPGHLAFEQNRRVCNKFTGTFTHLLNTASCVGWGSKHLTFDVWLLTRKLVPFGSPSSQWRVMGTFKVWFISLLWDSCFRMRQIAL